MGGWALYIGIEWHMTGEGTQAALMGFSEGKFSNNCVQSMCTRGVEWICATQSYGRLVPFFSIINGGAFMAFII